MPPVIWKPRFSYAYSVIAETAVSEVNPCVIGSVVLVYPPCLFSIHSPPDLACISNVFRRLRERLSKRPYCRLAYTAPSLVSSRSCIRLLDGFIHTIEGSIPSSRRRCRIMQSLSIVAERTVRHVHAHTSSRQVLVHPPGLQCVVVPPVQTL